jgi:hypothetical protein
MSANNASKQSEDQCEEAVGSESTASTVVNVKRNSSIRNIFTEANKEGGSTSPSLPSRSSSPKLIANDETNVDMEEMVNEEEDGLSREVLGEESKVLSQNDENVENDFQENVNNESIVIDEFEFHYKEDLGASSLNFNEYECKNSETHQSQQVSVRFYSFFLGCYYWTFQNTLFFSKHFFFVSKSLITFQKYFNFLNFFN